MKVNDEFYQVANAKIEEVAGKFESDLSQLKILMDAVLEENKFGLIAHPSIANLSNEIYVFLSDKLSEIATNVGSITNNYVAKVNEDDVW